MPCCIIVADGSAVVFQQPARGEVGLIFAGIGLGLVVKGQKVLDEATFSAILIMVMVTTIVTPPLLQWSFGSRKGRRKRGE